MNTAREAKENLAQGGTPQEGACGKCRPTVRTIHDKHYKTVNSQH